MEDNENGFMDSQYLSDTIRCTGYRSASNAISEIIDNSIEAEAKETFIIVSEGEVNGGKGITQIAFLDNGTGMDEETLKIALKLGASKKRDNRKGIGRFGVGLTQASMSVCTRVEVYSWQNGIENCKYVYLDLEEVEIKQQVKFIVSNEQIPDEYKKYMNSKWPKFGNEEIDFRESGTLVIWKKCDRNLPKKVSTLLDKLQINLGRKFRYLIESKEQRIFLISTDNESLDESILPNDPLFIMENNLVLGDRNKPTEYKLRNGENFTETFFEPFMIEGSKENGDNEVEIEYYDNKEKRKKTSKIIIKFSIVKPEFYSSKYISKKPGSIGVGKKIIKDQSGISIVRSNREIDFGRFGFNEKAEYIPEDRWWGCEIRFTPELDELFGVSNNKQGVILEKPDEEDEEIDRYESGEDYIKPIWLQMHKIIESTIKNMRDRNTALREEKTESGSIVTSSENAINNCDEENEDVKTITDTQREKITEEEKINMAKEILKNIKGVENPTEDDIKKILLNKVNIGYGKLARTNFFEIETTGISCNCIINTNHIFYKKFISKLEDNRKFIDIFEIFLASIARVMNEMSMEEEEKIQDFLDNWNFKLTKYIKSEYGEE